MAHIALYRKYRSPTFSALIGQDMVVSILQEAARQNRLSHAYLFSGPRGTGKTTVARLIAKVANCVKRHEDAAFHKRGEPCNECASCRSIDGGSALDVIEIDAASNRGIDEMRNLKEQVRVCPIVLRHRVFIIDEAHMLTREAANALLKTLEEPPNYVIIILATTELEKVPVTIASRAQQFRLKSVPIGAIVGKLSMIAKAEKAKISPEALQLIAASGEGSFRDAESLLDQMISLSGGQEIAVEDIERTIGAIGFRRLAAVADGLFSGDTKAVIGLLSEIDEEGHNVAQLAHDLIQYIRKAAVLSTHSDMREIFARQLVPEHLERLASHAAQFKPHHLALLKNLITAYGQMRYSQFPIIPLEVAILESLKGG